MIWVKDYLLNVLIALFILSASSLLVSQARGFYYLHAPIETFYTGSEIQAPDICLGDTKQQLISNRIVNGTDTGYNATVIRELYLVSKEQLQTKVFEEKVYPFVETNSNGQSYRIQQLPELEVGDYQWTLFITLYIYGVERSDITPLVSNVFQVKDCSV